MSYQEVLAGRRIAISASDSPDMAALGLSKGHLSDAMTEIARHLLALGATLCYAGDLRVGGFSELLFELIQRHRRDSADGDVQTGITNFLAWPVHLRMRIDEIEAAKDALAGTAELVCLDQAGSPIPFEQRRLIATREPSAAEWSAGLTSMRETVHAVTHARVVLGGQVHGYMGAMPGVAEEALLCLQAGSPLYLVGGFGGCTRDIAEALGLSKPWATIGRTWYGYDFFARFTQDSLRNGLTTVENELLARTPHIDQAVLLILRGLVRVDSRPPAALP